MGKTISDSERLTQITLNRKYRELEGKDKEIERLTRENEALLLQIREYKDTINQLCRELSSLVLNKHINA
jgi:predicted RNase H-like nuclease (RuvC/YqgF family)